PAIAASNGTVSLNKRLEQPVNQLRLNTDTGISDGKFQLLLLCHHAHNHLTFLGKLDGITHKIEQNLTQSAQVTTNHPGGLGIDKSHEQKSLFARFAGQHFCRSFDELQQIELYLFQFQAACLDFGKIKNLVN